MPVLTSPRRREADDPYGTLDTTASLSSSLGRKSRRAGEKRSSGIEHSLHRLAIGPGTFPRIVMDDAPRQGDDVWLMLEQGVVQQARVVGVDTISWPPRARVTRSDNGEMLVVPVLGADAVKQERRGSDQSEIRSRVLEEALSSRQWLAGEGSQNSQRKAHANVGVPLLDLPMKCDAAAKSEAERATERVGKDHSRLNAKHFRLTGLPQESKTERATMTSVYQVYEDNFDLITPRLVDSPTHERRRDDQSKEAEGGEQQETAVSSEVTEAVRKLRLELREEVRRGHSFLKGELQRVLYAQDRRINLRLDHLDARMDRLLTKSAESPRQQHADDSMSPVRRELQAIRQEVEAQRAFGLAT